MFFIESVDSEPVFAANNETYLIELWTAGNGITKVSTDTWENHRYGSFFY